MGVRVSLIFFTYPIPTRAIVTEAVKSLSTACQIMSHPSLSKASEAVKKLNGTEMRSGHTIAVSIANFDSNNNVIVDPAPVAKVVHTPKIN